MSGGFVITISGDHNDSTLLLGSESGSIKEENIYTSSGGGGGVSSASLDSINSKIASVEKSITSNVNKLQSIEGLLGQELGVDTSEITLLTSGISDNTSAISGTKTALEQNKNLITENTQVITTNRSKITEIQSEITTIGDSLSVNTNNIRVLKLSLETLEGNINSAAGNSSSNVGSSSNSTPVSASSSVSQLLAEINNLTNKLNSLENTVSLVESSVEKFMKPRVELNPPTFFIQINAHLDNLFLGGPATESISDTSINPIISTTFGSKLRDDLISSATEIKDISYVNSVSDISFGVFGNYTQTITVTDIFDNVTVVERPIIVGDFVGPVIKDSSSGVAFSGALNQGKNTKYTSLNQQVSSGLKPISLQSAFNETSVLGEDLYDFNNRGIYNPVTLLNKDLVLNKEGLYDLNYSSTDTCGNVTNATRKLYVYGTVGHTTPVGTLNSFDTSLKTANITKNGLVAPTVGVSLVIGGLKYKVISEDASKNIVGIPGKKDNVETIYDVTLDAGILPETVTFDKSVSVFNDNNLTEDVFDKFYTKPNPLYTFFEASGGFVYVDNSANDVIISDVSTGIYYNNFTDISVTDLIKTATDVSSLDYWVNKALYSGDASGLVYDVPQYLITNYAIPIGAYNGSNTYNTAFFPFYTAVGLVDNIPDASNATQALSVIEATFNAGQAGSGTLFVNNISGDVSLAVANDGDTMTTATTKSVVKAVLETTISTLANNIGVSTPVTESLLQTFFQNTLTSLVSAGFIQYKYLLQSKYNHDISSVLSRYVAIGDFSPPVLTDKGKTVNIYNYNDVSNLTLGDISEVMLDVTAFDKAHGDITSSIVRTVNGNTFLSVNDISLNVFDAEYRVTYDVSDSYNNAAVPLTKVFKFKDTEGPDVQLFSVTYEGGKPISKSSNDPSNPQLYDPSLIPYVDPIRNYAIYYNSSSAATFGQMSGISGEEYALRIAQGSYSDGRYDLTQLTVTVSGEQNVIRNKPGDYYVDITITDPDGNKTDVSRNIRINADTEGPIITLVDPEIKKYYDVFTFNYVEQGASAIDTVEGEKPVTIKYYKGDVSKNAYATEISKDMMINSYTGKGKQGLYSVKYSSKDNLDNTTTVVRLIYIFADESSPSITVDPSLIYVQPGEFDSSASFLASKYYDFKSGLHNFISVYDSQNPVIALNLTTTYTIPSGLPNAGTQDLCFNQFMDASDSDIVETIQISDPDGNSGFAQRRIRITDNAPPVITISGDPYPSPIILNISSAKNLSLFDAINNVYPITAFDTGASLRGETVQVTMVNNITVAESYAANGPWTRNIVLQSIDPCNNLMSKLERRVIVEPEVITVPTNYKQLGVVQGYSFDGTQVNVLQNALSYPATSAASRPVNSVIYVNGIKLTLDGSGNDPWVQEQYGNQVYSLANVISNTNISLTTSKVMYADISYNYVA